MDKQLSISLKTQLVNRWAEWVPRNGNEEDGNGRKEKTLN